METLVVTSLDGESIDLGTPDGRVVLVDFWATWCPPCLDSMPFYAELHARYAEQGFAVVAISVDAARQEVERFAERHALPFTFVWDEGTRAASLVRPARMPTAYLRGRDGRVRHVHEGFRARDKEVIEALVLELLADETASPSESTGVRVHADRETQEREDGS